MQTIRKRKEERISDARDEAQGMSGDRLLNRLLVVDNEPALARLVKNAAEGLGFEVVVAENPATFMETARIWRPTVLMLALRTPGIDGIQLLRGLAENKCTAHVVLIEWSG